MLCNTNVITDTMCGGISGPKKIYEVCRFAKWTFCNYLSYNKIGNYCHPSSCLVIT